MTSALEPDISVLAKNSNRQRQVRTVSGETSALSALLGRRAGLAARFCHWPRNLRRYYSNIAENKQRWSVSLVTLGQWRLAVGPLGKHGQTAISKPVGRRKDWSGRPGSNRRHPAWEAGVLPLNYSRSQQFTIFFPVITQLQLGCPRSNGG